MYCLLILLLTEHLLALMAWSVTTDYIISPYRHAFYGVLINQSENS